MRWFVKQLQKILMYFYQKKLNRLYEQELASHRRRTSNMTRRPIPKERYYILSDSRINNLIMYAMTHRYGTINLNDYKSDPIPDDLWDALTREPWMYRAEWLRHVRNVAHKMRKKGLWI